MVPVQTVVPAGLADVLRRAPLTPEKVAFAWRHAVGPTVERATRIAFSDGCLSVVTRDAAWRDELERSASVIRTRLDAVLGPQVVRQVAITVTP